jgi:hypothetical protein
MWFVRPMQESIFLGCLEKKVIFGMVLNRKEFRTYCEPIPVTEVNVEQMVESTVSHDKNHEGGVIGENLICMNAV